MNGYAQGLEADAWIGQLPVLLLVLAVLSQRFSRARALIAIGSLLGLGHALLLSQQALAALSWGVLLLASLLMLGRGLFDNSKSRFSQEEQAMLGTLLSGLPRSRARHLLDQGFWLSGREGDVLTREGDPVSHLYYLASGEAQVLSRGRSVGLCRAGDLVGEVTILSGERASATVMLTKSARLWCAPADRLLPYLEAHADVRHALEKGFALALRSKLRSSNELIADAGGLVNAER